MQNMSVDKFDGEMIEAILDKILTKENMIKTIQDIHASTSEWVKDRARRRAELVSQLRYHEKAIKNIYAIMEKTGDKTPGLDGLFIRIGEINKEMVDVELKLDQLEDEATPSDLISDTDAAEMERLLRGIIMGSNNPQKLREFFKTFIKKIVINGKDEERYARIEYHPDKFVNKIGMDFVRSGAGWLPDQGSNLGPAD